MLVRAPESVQIMPSKSHPFITTSRRTGLAVIGTLFQALYEVMKAFDLPASIAMRKGTE
jgi:hypothetical protein